jgi:hypothetical protein
MSDATTDTTAVPPGPADLIEIFYAPRAVFARRREGKFGLPYAALVVAGVVLYFATHSLMQPVMDTEIARSMSQAVASGKMTPEQAQAASSFGRKLGSVGLFAYWLLAPFIIGLFTWIAGRLSGVREIGRVAIMIATFSIFPRLISGVVGAVLAALHPEGSPISAASISLSPARFVDVAAHPGLAALLGRFDLFILWGIVLIAIGATAAAGATRGRAWSTAIGAWLIATLPSLWAFITKG